MGGTEIVPPVLASHGCEALPQLMHWSHRLTQWKQFGSVRSGPTQHNEKSKEQDSKNGKLNLEKKNKTQIAEKLP